MDSWEEARQRVEVEAASAAPLEPVPERLVARAEVSRSSPYVVTDRFDLAQLDVGAHGITIRVRAITRLDVMEIMQAHAPSVVALDERGQSLLEKELHLAPSPRATLTPSTKLVVCRRVDWRDVRWYLIEFLADGDGVVD